MPMCVLCGTTLAARPTPRNLVELRQVTVYEILWPTDSENSPPSLSSKFGFGDKISVKSLFHAEVLRKNVLKHRGYAQV